MDDSRLHPSIRTATRRTSSLILAAMATLGQRATAELMGISEATLSEMKNPEKLDRWASAIVALGFKLVPIGEQTFDPAIIGALKTFAVLGLDRVNTLPAEADA